jgi:2-polyprenyl-6-methoxyphenol hydroxylase-like FAD-dependent oxidoreductase
VIGRAIVIGGSVGGLMAANLLHRRGWQVDVFERVAEGLASRGAGIARHVELEGIMRAAGADPGAPVGIEVAGRSAFDRGGRLLDFFPYPQYLTAWALVFNPLLAALPADRYHGGRELAGIELENGQVVARLADGATVMADVLIGADGFRSSVRGLLAPQIQPRYGGYVAWRGLVEESALSPPFLADTFDLFSFLFPERSQFIGYPVAGQNESVRAGERRYNFLWYYPVDDGAELADLLTDARGQTYDLSIPPGLIKRSHIDRLIATAHALLSPRYAEAIGKAYQYMVQPIYDVESERIAFERVALIGDAAFVARPHVGVGVLKAGQDAQALTECLVASDSVAAALARYQALRLPAGHAAVAHGRRLGAFIERRLDAPTSDPDLGLSPETVIRISARPLEQLHDMPPLQVESPSEVSLAQERRRAS